MRILNFGSMNIDYVYRVKSIVKPGETISSTDVSTYCGGKGLNQSIALSKAGAVVYHSGMVGKDGDILINMLKNNGIDTLLIGIEEGRSGHTMIQVADDGQNSIVLYGGANRLINKVFIDSVLEKFECGDIILLQNEISGIEYIIKRAAEMGMKVIINPSPMDEKLQNMDLSGVYMIILNEIEGNQLTGKINYKDILTSINNKYPDVKVVLTLGKEGAVFGDGYEYYEQKSFDVKAVDTTAAGDTFTGYFIKDYLESSNPKHALEIASKASAITVTRAGAADSIPGIEEVLSYKFSESNHG